MATIYDISTEVFLNLVEFVDIDDLENFASTCKAFYNLSKDYLDTHLERKHSLTWVTLGRNLQRRLFEQFRGQTKHPGAKELRDFAAHSAFQNDDLVESEWDLIDLLGCLASDRINPHYVRTLCLETSCGNVMLSSNRNLISSFSQNKTQSCEEYIKTSTNIYSVRITTTDGANQ